jgi:hypothetical protein
MLGYINSPEFVSKLADNRFILICLVILLSKVKHASYKNMWLAAIVEIPGTILHEMSHFIVGFLLNAKPSSFSIIPKRTEDGYYTMGSVSFRNIRFYNALPSAMAPFLLLPLGIWIENNMLQNLNATLLNYVLYVLFQTIVIESAIPSRTDFKVAMKSVVGAGVFFAILAVAYYLFYIK